MSGFKRNSLDWTLHLIPYPVALPVTKQAMLALGIQQNVKMLKDKGFARSSNA